MPSLVCENAAMDEGSLHPRGRIQEFFGSIAGRYDFANHLLSAGCDFLWRRKAARMVADWAPERILDLATGSGDLALALHRACPGAVVIGADFCEPMLRKAQAKGIARLLVADALALPFPADAFDAVTIAFGLRNMESWREALREVARVLRPGGRLLILDFSMPAAPLRWLYRPYLHRVLPAVAAVVTGRRAVYQYLADSIERFPAGKSMVALLAECGLGSGRRIALQGGIVSLHVAEKQSEG